MEFTAVALALNVTLECRCDVQSCEKVADRKMIKLQVIFLKAAISTFSRSPVLFFSLTLMVKAFYHYVIRIIQNILKFQ